MRNGADRGERHRLSLITDVIILILVIILFVAFTSVLKNNDSSYISESLSLASIDPYEQASLLIDKINAEFGVKVVYGEQTRDDAEKVGASIQDDDYIAFENLSQIYNTFKLYPKKYFKNNNLTIVLLNEFKNNNIALASRNSLEQYKIYISNAKDYYRSINHELYHVFEYMLLNDERTSIDINWKNYNPIDFEYIDNIARLDNEYVYYDGCDLTNTYFVTRYSKASSKEDRAEIFAELMCFKEKNQSFFNSNMSKIRIKADYILQLLEKQYGKSDKYEWNLRE